MAVVRSGRQASARDAQRLTLTMRAIAQAARDGDLARGLRLADAALRVAPGQRTVQLLQARLRLRSGDHASALAALPDDPSDSDLQLLRLELLLATRRLGEAQALARQCLERAAIDHQPGLARLLDQLCLAIEAPGWVAVHSSLRLLVRARPPCEAMAGTAAAVRPLEFHEQAGWLEASLEPDATTAGEATTGGQLIAQTRQGAPLFGSSLPWPPAFQARGWVLREADQLRGAVALPWAPRLPLRLAVQVEGAAEAEWHAFDPAARAGQLQEFRIALPDSAASKGVEVAIELPDHRLQPLLGSPAADLPLPARAVSSLRPVRPVWQPNSTGQAVDIVIPVYAGRSETLRCVQGAIASRRPAGDEVVVVNDASPDAELVRDLQALADSGTITLLHQPHNQGFAASVNLGIARHPRRDVVVLNADCVVHGDWLQRLQRAAHSSHDIGSVTPFGQAASVVSYPLHPVAGERLDSLQLDRLAAQVNGETTVDLPVAVGFCMYLRRGCLDETGPFDAARFLRGYGEENDFCLRASALGWRHVAATGVYVDHLGGRSFGGDGELWRARNQELLKLLHPGYDRLVGRFVNADPLHPARRALDIARLHAWLAGRAPALLVSLALPGGVQRHVDARAAELAAQGRPVLLLRPLDERPGEFRLETAGTTPPPLTLADLRLRWPDDDDLFSRLLDELRPDALEIHHFLDLPAGLIERLQQAGCPLTIHVHDHAWLCPRLSMTGGNGRYCGDPAVATCESCVREHGSELEAGLGVEALRARSRRWLGRAEDIVLPCQDTRQRYQRHFPGLPLRVQPLEQEPAPQLSAEPAGARLVVLVIGAISTQKGHAVLLECAQLAARHDLPVDFRVVGYTEDDQPLLDTGRVFITGPYRDEELPGLLARQRGQLAWFPAVAPETWCYSLTHALRAGLPVAGFDLGAIGERLHGHPYADLHAPTLTPEQVLHRLFEFSERLGLGKSIPSPWPFSDNPESIDSPATPPVAPPAVPIALAAASVPAETAPPPTTDSLPTMDGSADAGPTALAAEQPAAADANRSAVHAASVQPLTLPEGVYAIAVPRAAETPAADGSGLRLPAMGVGLAPLPQSASVDLFPAPGTLDRWLTRPGDQITVRIAGGQASLMLTSVRPADASPLAIEVRRLDVPLALPDEQAVTLRTLLHVQWLGDVHFTGALAGPLGFGLGIEALVLDCRDAQGASLLEYRGQTADGFDTPWLTDGVLCGSRGRGVPLLGFAVRPRVTATLRYQLSYRGYFRNAGWVAAQQAGDWCRSTLPQDALEGLEVVIVPAGGSSA